MTRAECAERRKIVQNMAWYLGVNYTIPECSAVKCPEGECDRLKAERHNLANAYVQPLDDKQRDEVRKDHLSMSQYSFFSSDDYDRLGKKAPTISFDYLKDCLKRLNGEEPSETAEGSTEEEHKETDLSTEIGLDEYLKNHKVSNESTEESQDNNEQAEELEADIAESNEEPETESAEVESNFDTDNDTDVDTSSVVVYTLDDNEDDLINSDEADEI